MSLNRTTIYTVPCPHFACGGEIEAIVEDGTVSLNSDTCSEGWEVTAEEAAEIEREEAPKWQGPQHVPASHGAMSE